jgi:hypothetical protein
VRQVAEVVAVLVAVAAAVDETTGLLVAAT